MNVLVADKFEKSGLEGLHALGCEVVYEPAAGADGMAAAIEKTVPEVLVVRSTKVQASALAKPGKLKLIIRAGAGVDNIDVAAATAAGVAVCNCPGMNSVAVAETVFAHLLCCDRRIPEQTDEARSGRWNKKEYAKAKGLKGMTLGVVGAGAIGRAVIKRAIAFEMDVVAWSRSITREHAADLGARFGGTDTPALMELAKVCDAVSIHLPATESTKKLIGAEFFGHMKPGAYFINTSRGSIVDEAALRDAVRTKGIRAGLDVFENQPPTPEAPWDNETVKLPGVYASHHIGASTDQAQQAVAEETVRIVSVYMKTGAVENRVN